jgi:hypothetical protein
MRRFLRTALRVAFLASISSGIGDWAANAGTISIAVPVHVDANNPARVDFTWSPPHAFQYGWITFQFGNPHDYTVDYPFTPNGLNPGDSLGFQVHDGNNNLLGSQSIVWNTGNADSNYGNQINCGHPGTCFFPSPLTTTTWSLFVTAASGSFDLVSVSMLFSDPTFGALGLGGQIEGQSRIEVSMVPGPTVGAGIPGLLLAAGGLVGWWRRSRRIETAV